jgi:hypothetical protein
MGGSGIPSSVPDHESTERDKAQAIVLQIDY